MAAHQLNSKFSQRSSLESTANPSRLSVLGILFFIMGAPNIYAFLQRRTDAAATTTFNGSGMPRYAVAVLVAMAIASLVELSLIV
jgi:hypothetical protein